MTLLWSKGKGNKVPNALSRQIAEQLWAFTTPMVQWVNELKSNYNTDLKIQEILKLMKEKTFASLKHQLKGGLLLYKKSTSANNVPSSLLS